MPRTIHGMEGHQTRQPLALPPAVIARSESPKRRSNPLNRAAQENPQSIDYPQNPRGIAVSCLAALLAMTMGET